jgi:hypothetical protein
MFISLSLLPLSVVHAEPCAVYANMAALFGNVDSLG